MGVAGTEYVETDVSVPLLPSKLNECTAGLCSLPTNRYFPFGSVAIKLGCGPVPKGELVSNVSDPSDPIE